MTPNPTTSLSPILVALGSDARTLRLVHAGFRMAREQGRPWVVAHVEVLGWETPEEADQARVWLQEAHELGAEVTWIKAPTVVGGLLTVARKRLPAVLVLGENRSRGPWDRIESSRAKDLLNRNLDIRIVALPLDSTAPKGPAFQNLGDVVGIVGAVAVILVVTTIFAAALSVVAGFPAIPGLFALATGFVAHRWGRGVAVLGTLGAFAVYAFLFGRPGSGFSAETWPHFIFFAASLMGSQMLVDLVGRLRLETRAGRRREAETVLLMLLGRALARCSTVQEAAEVLAQRLHSLLQAEAWMLLPGEGDTWVRLPAGSEGPACPPPSALLPEFGLASTRLDPLEPFYVSPCSFVPLAGTRGTEGVLQLRLAEGRIPQESWGLLQAFAVAGSLAMERIRWVEKAQAAHLENETERMRSGLLGAVSHDLRTPLAAIQGAATSLLLPEEALSEATRTDLLVMIREESDRLTRLLSNLLDLTRLESGVIRVHKEWQPLDEVVGAVIGRLERGGGPFPVRAELPEDLPLVPIDGGLMEQVFFNLLINAHRHAQASEVLLKAWAGELTLELEVSDRGPGVASEFHLRVFDKFFRLPGQTTDGGVGLGLAICDAIVKAHGGRIWVEDRPGGGASFRITLPLGEAPPDLPPELHEPGQASAHLEPGS